MLNVRLMRLSGRALMLAAVMLTTTACVSRTGGNETVLCKSVKPITWEDADTDATIREVKEHNAVYKRLCR